MFASQERAENTLISLAGGPALGAMELPDFLLNIIFLKRNLMKKAGRTSSRRKKKSTSLLAKIVERNFPNQSIYQKILIM
jgi:cytidylate kinase